MDEYTKIGLMKKPFNTLRAEGFGADDFLDNL